MTQNACGDCEVCTHATCIHIWLPARHMLSSLLRCLTSTPHAVSYHTCTTYHVLFNDHDGSLSRQHVPVLHTCFQSMHNIQIVQRSCMVQDSILFKCQQCYTAGDQPFVLNKSAGISMWVRNASDDSLGKLARLAKMRENYCRKDRPPICSMAFKALQGVLVRMYACRRALHIHLDIKSSSCCFAAQPDRGVIEHTASQHP